MKFDGLLFDLFGTVVHFATAVPTISAGGERRRSTLGWLREAVDEALPGIVFDDFLASVLAVTKEIVAGRSPEYIEVPSPERLRRALRRSGVGEAEAIRLGAELSAIHMRHLASQTVLPAGHAELLAALAPRYRMGIVSNFDHGPTAIEILRTHGVLGFFSTVTVSDGFGRRKPHPAIFRHALQQLGTPPEATLFVGDSWEDDVVGASAVGLPVAWIAAAEAVPEGDSRLVPTLRIQTLDDLRRVLL